MTWFRCSGNEKHYATISVSTDYLFGETVTCTCADVEYSRTATFSDDGEASFTVNDWGTYTLTADGKNVTVVVSAWYVTYEAEFAGSVEVTLTLEGAMNDTITIKNSNGATVGTCIFNNSTTGQTTIAISIDGGEYSFVSSVSKATDGSGADYEKTVTLTSETSNIKVMPDGALYWYGNGQETMDFPSAVKNADYDYFDSYIENIGTIPGNSTISKQFETNDIALSVNRTSGTHTVGSASVYFKNKVNLSETNRIGFMSTDRGNGYHAVLGIDSTKWVGNRRASLTKFVNGLDTVSYLDVSDVVGNYYIGASNTVYGSLTVNPSNCKIYAIWLE